MAPPRKKEFDLADLEIERRLKAELEAALTPKPVTGYAGFLFEWENPVIDALGKAYLLWYRLADANHKILRRAPQPWAARRLNPFLTEKMEQLDRVFWRSDSERKADFQSRLEAALKEIDGKVLIDRASALPRPLGRTSRAAPSARERIILAAVRDGKHGLDYCKRLDFDDVRPPSSWPGGPRTYLDAHKGKRSKPLIWKERSRIVRRWK